MGQDNWQNKLKNKRQVQASKIIVKKVIPSKNVYWICIHNSKFVIKKSVDSMPKIKSKLNKY